MINDFDINQMGVFMEIVPSPSTKREWEIVRNALLDCAIDYPIPKQYSGNGAMPPVPLNTCFFFKIPSEKLLFVNGERFQAAMCGPSRTELSIFAVRRTNHSGCVVAPNDGGRKNEYAPEIKLSLMPPTFYAKKFQEDERREQAKGRRRQQRKEIWSWCLEPFKRMFGKPVKHSESPNAVVSGAAGIQSTES